jgi:hypothetical protein
MSLLSILNREERRQARLFRSAKAREDLIAQIIDETRTWKEIDRGIAASEDPTALIGGYAGLEVTPSIKDLATVTGGATELAIIPVVNTPIPVTPQAPKLYRLFASGTSTTAATPGTYTLAGRVGNANTSPLFGAVSGALTPVASATAAQWRLFGVVFIRQSGTAGTGVGTFEFNHSATVGGGGPVSATGNAIFGGILASTDFTLATNGLWIGVTHATSTTNTWVPQLPVWASWS